MAISAVAKQAGSKVLFVGVEAVSWAIGDFGRCARNARAMGFDTICAKRADGAIRWYGTAGHLRLERQACLSEGCGFIPLQYAYGPALGPNQIGLEVGVAREMHDVCNGLVCIDMETQWNGQAWAAQKLAGLLKGIPGLLFTTWADPQEQAWAGVVEALKGTASAWIPQEYTNWLGGREGEYSADGVPASALFPALDVSGEFAGSDPMALMRQAVARGHGSVWIWEYMYAMKNPQLIRSMLAVMGHPINNVHPVDPPHTPVRKGAKLPTQSYTIQDGDSLTGIAEKLHIANWFQDLYLPNKGNLDQAARAHGEGDSHGGNLIYPGTVLQYLVHA